MYMVEGALTDFKNGPKGQLILNQLIIKIKYVTSIHLICGLDKPYI